MTTHISKSIDFIRGLAAIGVIWGHTMYIYGKPFDLNGAFWVWIFLGMSGYLVGINFNSGRYKTNFRGYSQFLFNRGLRILPLAYLAMIIGLVIFYYVNEKVPENVIQQFLFIPKLNNMELVGPLWTIAAELKFYIFSILLIILIGSIKKLVYLTVPLFILLFVASIKFSMEYVQFIGDNLIQPRTFFGNFAFFVLGLLLANSIKYNIQVKYFTKFIFILGLIIWAFYLQNYSEYFWKVILFNGRYDAPISGGSLLAMAIIIVTLGLEVEKKEQSWDAGILSFVTQCSLKCGFYCYGIYIWHALLLLVNRSFLEIPLGIMQFSFVLLSIPLAIISYSIFEKPLLKYKK